MSINSLEMSINSLEKYFSNRLTNHLMRTGLLYTKCTVYSIITKKKTYVIGGAPGRAGKSSFDIWNSECSAGCFTIPTNKGSIQIQYIIPSQKC